MIFDQQLLPGQKLVQEKLSAELGISRSPLLKALEKLESELLIEKIPRRGMFVKEMTLKEIIDVFQCRAVLEGLSARLAAFRITTEQIQKLKAIFEPFIGKKRVGAEVYAEADRAFHNYIMQWSQNAAILRLEVLSNIHLKAYQAGLLRPPKDTMGEHLAIIDALAEKNGPLAETLMKEHIEKSVAALKRRKESVG